MKKNTPYQCSRDGAYDRKREESLTEREREILKTLQEQEGACIINKNLAQISREQQCSARELRCSMHRLEQQGLVKTVESGGERHYKLTRAGERANMRRD